MYIGFIPLIIFCLLCSRSSSLLTKEKKKGKEKDCDSSEDEEPQPEIRGQWKEEDVHEAAKFVLSQIQTFSDNKHLLSSPFIKKIREILNSSTKKRIRDEKVSIDNSSTSPQTLEASKKTRLSSKNEVRLATFYLSALLYQWSLI